MALDRLGKYKVIRRIASGGMAEVYLCRLTGEEGFEKKVAVKVIHPRYSEDPRFRERFVREAKIAASLSHHNLVQVFDFGKEGRSYYLAMEYVDGWNLAQVISQMRQHSLRIPVGIWKMWVGGILEGIGYLHSRGVIHSDISPGNVLVSGRGLVKITDLGIALSVHSGTAADRGGVGKLGYMSPEQVMGESASYGSDLFSAAIISAELFLSGRLFEVASRGSFEEAIRNFDPAKLELGNLHVEVANVIRKALSRDIHNRYGNAELFLRAVSTAVPVPAEKKEFTAYWEKLFPSSGEEETQMLVAAGPPSQNEVVRERREPYGYSGRGVKIGAASALIVLSVGGALIWKQVNGERQEGPAPSLASRPSTGGSPQMARGSNGSNSSYVEPMEKPEKQVGALRSSSKKLVRDVKSLSSLPPGPAMVLLETEPAGAAVNSEEGSTLGRTPLHFDARLWAGKRVVIMKEGYIEKAIPVDALLYSGVFRMELERQMGTVEVIQATPWAKVYEGDRLLGETPIYSIRLSAGEHDLRFVNEPLGIEKTEKVVIRPGVNPKLIVPLTGKR